MKQSVDQDSLESPQEFNHRIGLGFKNQILLARALTHRSYINENPHALEDNERLEFLGDAVLDFIVGAWLYHHYPEMAEGELTLVRTALVRTEQLAEFARQIDLGRAIRLGQGEIVSGGRMRNALLCAGFEALIGGLYLDQGIEAVELFFEPYLSRAVEKILVGGHPRDPKSTLQEWTQARGMNPPVYQTIKESGPDHEKVFTVELRVEGQLQSAGRGTTKKEAQQNAARAALEKLTREAERNGSEQRDLS